MNRDTGEWLDTAVSGIRFKPDRAAVRAELEGHLEDKTADLHRIFPDIPEEEARARALNSMGDPEEIKTELARVHKAWLAYLWAISRNIVICGLGVFLGGLLFGGPNDWYDSNDRMADMYAQYTLELTPDSREISVDGYTISMVEAKGRPAGTAENIIGLCVRLRMAGPRFWALNGQGLCDRMEAEDSQGNRYVQIDEQFDIPQEERSDPFCCVAGNDNGRGPFHRDYDLYVLNVDPAAQWVRLEYDWLGRNFSMTVELKEGER